MYRRFFKRFLDIVLSLLAFDCAVAASSGVDGGGNDQNEGQSLFHTASAREG